MNTLSDIREKAKEAYESLPLPFSKYTTLTWWPSYTYPEKSDAEIELDFPEGVEILKEGEIGDIVPIDSWKFVSFHYANLNDIIILRVPEGLKIERAARIKVKVKGREHLHVKVYVGKGSSLTLILESEGGGLYTEVVEARVREGGSLIVGSVEDLDGGSVVFADRGMIVERDGTGKLVGSWLGGNFVMSKHKVTPVGENASVEDVQVLFGSGSQHYDLTTYLNFTSPASKGESTIRAVLKDKARAVLYGMIDVQQEAKHTDAYLSEHSLLLNSGARADSIPGLEIMTDEVRATHGATVGPIDKEQVFYLMSRGLSEIEAKKLIVLGFFEPALSRIGLEDIREHVEEVVESRMS